MEIKKRGGGLVVLFVAKATPSSLGRSYHKYYKSSEDMALPMLQRILFRADPFLEDSYREKRIWAVLIVKPFPIQEPLMDQIFEFLICEASNFISVVLKVP